jgi:hypothetical protein
MLVCISVSVFRERGESEREREREDLCEIWRGIGILMDGRRKGERRGRSFKREGR